jgi:hypothetical protein
MAETVTTRFSPAQHRERIAAQLAAALIQQHAGATADDAAQIFFKVADALDEPKKRSKKPRSDRARLRVF